MLYTAYTLDVLHTHVCLKLSLQMNKLFQSLQIFAGNRNQIHGNTIEPIEHNLKLDGIVCHIAKKQ